MNPGYHGCAGQSPDARFVFPPPPHRLLRLWNAAVLFLLCQTLPAALVLHEAFSYPDGPLLQAAPEAWFNYSGTSNQIQVRQGRVRLSESLTEDAQVFLPGRPYTNGVLYVRFLMNYSRLPSGGGGCFVLLKDAGVNNNRACIYATTMEAPPGHYRLGLRLTGVTSPLYALYHPRACPTNADQVVVLRYQLNPPAATLWVNPLSEQDAALEVAPDSTAPLAIHALALRQSLASGNGMGELLLDGLRLGFSFAEVTTAGAPPTLSALPDLQLSAGGWSPALPLTLADEDTPLPFIYLYATAEPPELIPPAFFAFSGSGSQRTLTFQAAPGLQGTACVTVTALDDTGLSAQRTFTVVIGAPVCAPIPDQLIRVNETLASLPLALADAEQDPLTIQVFSSDRTLFPATHLIVSGQGYHRQLTLRPAPDRAGHAVISVVISDGHHQITNRFQVTVAPHPGRLLVEEFDYPNGPLTAVGQACWQPHSGQPGQALVQEGKLRLSMDFSEDASALLAGQPFSSGSGYVLYARMDFRLLSLPTNAAPAYWAHYKDGGNGFRARLFVSTNQAPPGHYRLGVSSASASPTAEVPLNLATQRFYTVITRFNVNNGQCVLWVEPASETDAATVATDATATSTIVAWAFRQAANIGFLEIERLIVGTAFADVLAPPSLTATRAGHRLVLRWPDEPGWQLQTAESLSPAAWQTLSALPPAESGWRSWTLDMVEPRRFFRLWR